MGLFDSLLSATTSLATIVTKPIEVIADVVDAAAKPIAEVVTDLAEDIKDALK